MNSTELKLVQARTRLIMDKPFLGALVLRLQTKMADPKWCQTTATDAKNFYYSAKYIKSLNINQVQFVLAHEALHCAFSHFARRQHRNKHRWDLACDYAINPLLIKDELTPPPGVWIEDSFTGMTAEEIYPMIDENNADEPMDKHVYSDEQQKSSDGQGSGINEQQPNNTDDDTGGNVDNQPTQPKPNQGEFEPKPEFEGVPQPPPLNDKECQNLATQWQERLAGATQQAMQAGKLSGAMTRIVEHLLQPQLPWRALLARYMTINARDDYTYSRLSRRDGPAILPSQRSSSLNIVVAIDISGSISNEEVAQYLTEINALKGQIRAKITLLACDAELTEDSPWIIEPWENFISPREFIGGGGTSFKPVFDYIETNMMPPDLLIYFTDASGEFPEQQPSYSTIWLVKGKKKTPWGQRIQLN